MQKLYNACFYIVSALIHSKHSSYFKILKKILRCPGEFLIAVVLIYVRSEEPPESFVLTRMFHQIFSHH